MSKGRVLVTGGAGYIGSHTTLALLQAGFSVVVLDSLINGSKEALRRVEEISGKRVVFCQADVRDSVALDAIFSAHHFFAVLHFAGLKAVGESTQKPLSYYDNNVIGTIRLCEAMSRAGVGNLVFSSSATVYGEPLEVPMSEDHHTGNVTNPYGRSKYFVEKVLQDLVAASPSISVATLRYFNPIGAHESGWIGEHPSGTPNNLLPFVSQVAVGRREYVPVFGNDYETIDGTGVRDYVHVMDLAEGHVAALAAFSSHKDVGMGFRAWNLGTGRGFSVLQVIEAFESASHRKVPFRFMPRRPGDIAVSYADVSRAERELGWTARRNLSDMMVDTWRWQSLNPRGFDSERP